MALNQGNLGQVEQKIHPLSKYAYLFQILKYCVILKLPFQAFLTGVVQYCVDHILLIE